MNGLSAGFARDIQYGFSTQVGFRGPGGADVPGLLCHIYVTSMTIRIRVNRNRCDTESFTSLHDATSDFAAIGDQNFLEHELFFEPGRAAFFQKCRQPFLAFG